MISTTVPMTIEPDAAEQIDKLGLRREFEQMLDHVLRTIPDLRRINVTITPGYEMEMDWITFDAFGLWGDEQLRQIEDEYSRWVWKTFPPEAHIHFAFSAYPA